MREKWSACSWYIGVAGSVCSATAWLAGVRLTPEKPLPLPPLYDPGLPGTSADNTNAAATSEALLMPQHAVACPGLSDQKLQHEPPC